MHVNIHLQIQMLLRVMLSIIVGLPITSLQDQGIMCQEIQ